MIAHPPHHTRYPVAVETPLARSRDVMVMPTIMAGDRCP